MGVTLGVIVYITLGYGYWRHDALAYLGDYTTKLSAEGRWLYWLLFYALQSVPGHLAWLFSFSLYGIVCALIADRLVRGDPRFDTAGVRAAIVLVALSQPFLHDILAWPVMLSPACLVLIAAALASYRLPAIIVLPVASILLGGLIQSFCYFLPLLYLQPTRRLDRPLGDVIRDMAVLLAIWAGSFILAILFAQGLTYLILGSPVEIAQWRNPQPAENIGDLLANIWTNISQVPAWLGTLSPAWPLLAVGLAAAILYGIRTDRTRLAGALPLLFFGAALLFCHAVIAAPTGIMVQGRTMLHAMFSLIVFALAAAQILRARVGFFALALILWLPAYLVTINNIAWFAEQTRVMRSDVAKALPRPASSYAGVIIDGREARPYFKTVRARTTEREVTIPPLHWVHRMQPALFELGFSHVRACDPGRDGTLSRRCQTILGPFDGSSCKQDRRLICPVGVTQDNHLIVRPSAGYR